MNRTEPDDADTDGRAVPPYEGRRKSADVAGKEKTSKDGARTAGATGPVEDDDMKAPEPGRTRGGATASPADEQAGRPDDGRPPRRRPGTGPAHHRGTPRGEDQS